MGRQLRGRHPSAPRQGMVAPGIKPKPFPPDQRRARRPGAFECQDEAEIRLAPGNRFGSGLVVGRLYFHLPLRMSRAKLGKYLRETEADIVGCRDDEPTTRSLFVGR